jgi:hypothetical protein
MKYYIKKILHFYKKYKNKILNTASYKFFNRFKKYKKLIFIQKI